MAIKWNGITKGNLAEELTKVIGAVAWSEWGDAMEESEESVEVRRLTGAMTNEVYQIKWKNPKSSGAEDRKVVVRVYGEGVEVFFNRDDEIRTFEWLSKLGHGPRLLAQFSHGRVEEFIHARTLSATDLRDSKISALIASKLREFHNLEMPAPKNVVLWDRMRYWLSEAKRLSSPIDVEEFWLETLEEEINMLQRELSKDSQLIGFCHNDLQYGNIMMDQHTSSITLIDYEYASYNPIAYDIANHFCEMAADYHSETPHILDYTSYPDLKERKQFVRAYLTSTGRKANEEEVEEVVEEAEKYTLPNHLFWGLWGIISGHINKIDFDYFEYARQRFDQYWLRKPVLLVSSIVDHCHPTMNDS
ncbi:probable choline kinase 1 isoform X1 [Momordica charantia]|uniref:Probable choline kinase 1 isoform X1 n=1 Tax=Momordica charantia TaxID=3673 RepID=A0A6J1CQU6_MOMCH|nr:probable choline kinase 1 isoform X1 [Momordica charantia]XP_022143627.1 probable choline kinase 1 isoform X1 [Momordica charantia]